MVWWNPPTGKSKHDYLDSGLLDPEVLKHFWTELSVEQRSALKAWTRRHWQPKQVSLGLVDGETLRAAPSPLLVAPASITTAQAQALTRPNPAERLPPAGGTGSAPDPEPIRAVNLAPLWPNQPSRVSKVLRPTPRR